MEIGVLDIQGSVKEHFEALKKAGVSPILVKTIEDLERVSGLIMPGGESTTIGKLLRRFGLREAIIERVKNGMPIWGTCAGAILLAKKIEGKQNADSLGLMDIVIERNAYGGQLDSFETQIEFDCGVGVLGRMVPAIFIRAPKILGVGADVEVLIKKGEEIVGAREEKILATTFHPELTDDLHVHQYFIEMCKDR